MKRGRSFERKSKKTSVMPSAGKAADELLDVSGEPGKSEALDLGGGRIRTGACKAVDHRGFDLGARIGINQAPDAAFSKGIETAVAVAGDHRQARGGRLQEGDAEALAGARHGEDAGECKIVRELRVRNLARKHHAIRDASPVRQPLQPGAVV